MLLVMLNTAEYEASKIYLSMYPTYLIYHTGQWAIMG